MATLKENIDLNNLPNHVAVIMDGNGRWAKQQGAARIFGHRNAIGAVKDITEACAEIGVKYLTLYAFSTENWGRPKDEVAGLMELLVNTLQKELKTLLKNNVRLITIGGIDHLPMAAQKNLMEAKEATKANSGLTLLLALNYSGRWEITKAAMAIVEAVESGKIERSSIDESLFSSFLDTAGIPDPELVIRTSGEMRISNFLLWQMAYSEFYFTKTLWPDFGKENLYEAICDYQKRERRFGKVSIPTA